ncbi:hypothetical protein BGX31_002711 [Mortierella sp. GBA43]|nr:hypothetical protein BGX31_002711 [Mortierella sp. GBA43]
MFIDHKQFNLAYDGFSHHRAANQVHDNHPVPVNQDYKHRPINIHKHGRNKANDKDKDKDKDKDRDKDMYRDKDKSVSEASIGIIWGEQGHGKPVRTRVSRILDMISLNIS